MAEKGSGFHLRYNSTDKKGMPMKMDKKTILIGLAVILAVFAIGKYLHTNPSKSLPEASIIKAISSQGELNLVLENAGPRLVVLDFYATWCGPCRLLHPTMEALATKFAGKAEFFRIDIDKSQGIAVSFGARGIPYVVFVKNKQAIASLIGVNPAESYEKIIKENSPPADSGGKVL
jgi:thioredoxin